MAKIHGAFAPKANLRPQFGAVEPAQPACPVGCKCWRCADWDDGERDCSAQRRHRWITTAQNAALHAVPSVAMVTFLSSVSAPHAIEAGLSMMLVQQSAMRVPAWRESDAVEWGAIVAGGAVAIAIVASATPVAVTTLTAAAALTALLALWPHAFHRWRGATVTDFELACGGPPPPL